MSYCWKLTKNLFPYSSSCLAFSLAFLQTFHSLVQLYLSRVHRFISGCTFRRETWKLWKMTDWQTFNILLAHFWQCSSGLPVLRPHRVSQLEGKTHNWSRAVQWDSVHLKLRILTTAFHSLKFPRNFQWPCRSQTVTSLLLIIFQTSIVSFSKSFPNRHSHVTYIELDQEALFSSSLTIGIDSRYCTVITAVLSCLVFHLAFFHVFSVRLVFHAFDENFHCILSSSPLWELIVLAMILVPYSCSYIHLHFYCVCLLLQMANREEFSQRAMQQTSYDLPSPPRFALTTEVLRYNSHFNCLFKSFNDPIVAFR